jgi:hypothetical protein
MVGGSSMAGASWKRRFDEDRRLASRGEEMGESPVRREEVDDFRWRAGDDDLLSMLMELALRRKELGVGRCAAGVDTSRRRSERGVLTCTGDEGGSAVRVASWRVSLLEPKDSVGAECLVSSFVGRTGAAAGPFCMSSKSKREREREKYYLCQ